MSGFIPAITNLGGFSATIGQVEVTGGSPLVVVAVFVLLAVTTILSLVITYRFARGYLRTGTRPFLLLAVGLFLLTAAPTFVRLAFTNLLGGPSSAQTLVASVSELLGLLTILYTIYQ